MALLFGVLFAGEADAGPLEAPFNRVAELAARQGVTSELSEVAETPALAGLNENLAGSLSAADHRLLDLVTFLASPALRRAHEKIEAHEHLDRVDRIALRRAIAQIGQSPAVDAMRRRGERLKRNPARLRVSWRRLVGAIHSKVGSPGAPDQTPIGRSEAAARRPIGALGGRSIAAAAATLLSSRRGFRWLQGLPPLALGMTMPVGRGSVASSMSAASLRLPPASAASLCSSGSLGPSVETMLKFLAQQDASTLLEDVTSRHFDNPALQKYRRALAYNLAPFGEKAPAWRRAKALDLFSAALSRAKNLFFSPLLGNRAMDAAWNAVLKCGAKFVMLVPNPAKRQAGDAQSYSLLAEDKDGKSWGGIRADSLTMSGGDCQVVEESCVGEKLGDQVVEATFGTLKARGKFTVTPGPLRSLKLEPSSSDAGLDEPTARFHATGEDLFGNEQPVAVGPLNGEAHLSIAPEGSCELSWCVAHEPGPHTVTARVGDIRDVVEVDVMPNKLVLSPETASIRTGDTQGYGAQELSWGGKLLRPAVPFGAGPGEAHLTIYPPDGSCDDAAGACTVNEPGVSGAYLVTATTQGERAVGHAVLEVVGTELSLSPARRSIWADESQSYTAREVSTGDPAVDFGPVTIGPAAADAMLSIEPDGHCDQAAGSCTADAPGWHTVIVEPGAGSTAKSGQAELYAQADPETSSLHWSGTITLTEEFGFPPPPTSAGDNEQVHATWIVDSSNAFPRPQFRSGEGVGTLLRSQASWSRRRELYSDHLLGCYPPHLLVSRYEASGQGSWEMLGLTVAPDGYRFELSAPLGHYKLELFGAAHQNPDLPLNSPCVSTGLQGTSEGSVPFTGAIGPSGQFGWLSGSICSGFAGAALPRVGSRIVGSIDQIGASGGNCVGLGDDPVSRLDFDLTVTCNANGLPPDDDWACPRGEAEQR